MKVYHTILLILFLISCSSQSFTSLTAKSYEYSLNKLDSTLVEHFPKSKEIGKYGFQTNFVNNDTLKLCNTCFSTSSLILYKTVKQEVFDSIMTITRDNSIAKYNSTDSTILALSPYNDRIEIEGRWHKDLETKQNKIRCKKNSKLINRIPIPYFTIDEYSDSSSLCNLSSNFEIFVIKAIPGRNKNSIEYDCECIPDKWKHGSIAGYAVDNVSKGIIIWATVW